MSAIVTLYFECPDPTCAHTWHYSHAGDWRTELAAERTCPVCDNMHGQINMDKTLRNLCQVISELQHTMVGVAANLARCSSDIKMGVEG